ncbi:MAG: hypothetical protein ABW036_06055, partial [Flavitalea sp.]
MLISESVTPRVYWLIFEKYSNQIIVLDQSMRIFSLIISFLIVCAGVNAQGTSASFAFIDYQKSFPRINDALKRKQDTLMKQFREKGLEWPAKYIYIRSFKYDSHLEVWVKSEKNEQYKLFKNYRVCALAGTLGP